mgnify:CR=1 FL=1
MSNILAKLPDALLGWYEENKRKLPWRGDLDPYHIWLSEIMLQQTRVEVVKGYYNRFLAAIPSVEALAQADDGLLHKLWEGLGYYSRVRNLKKAAQVIVNQYGGVFPRDHKQVLSLPGIGPYTAGAICSIAFNQPLPAVDGNVLRLVTRLTNDPTPIDEPTYKKQVQDALRAVYPTQAGDFTQALMELGATVCGPNRKPDCWACPCKDFCQGYQSGAAENLPVKLPKKPRKQENRTVFILSCNGTYALQKRGKKGLLADLWEFPNISGKLKTEESLSKVEEMGLKPQSIFAQVERKHVFTHIEWDMYGVYVEVAEAIGSFAWLTAEEISAQAALPTAFRQFLPTNKES